MPGPAASGAQARRLMPTDTPRIGINSDPLPLPASAAPGDAAVSPTFFQQDNTKNPAASNSVESSPSGSEVGKYADLGFGKRLAKSYFDKKEESEQDPASPNKRPGMPVPFATKSPPFPFQEHIGPNIGVNDASVYPLMEALYNGPNGQKWKDSRLKIYGWLDPSYTFGTSRRSNIPLAYNIKPNSLQLSQAIVIFERSLDTVQQDHFDYGFKATNLYGIDYRYTTAKGYFSNQLLKHNHLYGYDPLQLYMDFYFPKLAQGTILRIGRYISPIDIEAQLSPENYLYSHSIMYGYDPYTFTGVQFTFKLSNQWTLMVGAHAGNDMAPWTKSSQANGEILLKWVSKDGKDSLFGGVDSIGKGYYSNQHDNLQVVAGTWSHKFNERFHTLTEVYYLFERSALKGGTVTNGPPDSYNTNTGPGPKIPGLSSAVGFVNYTAYALSDKAYAVLRNSILYDPQGFRTGYNNFYDEVTLGLAYHITPYLLFRPEIRYERGFNNPAYDNGTKKDQYTTSADLIFRF